MKKIILIGILAGLLLLNAACSEQGDASAGTGKAAPPLPVEVMVATTAGMTEGVNVTGTLTAKFETDVRSEVPGLVKEVYVTEWVAVKKGTPLARIDTRDAQALVNKAQAALESAKAVLLQEQVSAGRARRELGRMSKLWEGGLVTQQNLDDALTESDAASAKISAAQAQLMLAKEELSQARIHLNRTLIVSPMDGVVSLRAVNPGDLAGDSGGPLFHIVDNSRLNLMVSVASSRMAKVNPGQPLEFTTDALPGRTFSAYVMFVNPSIDMADRSVKVIAEVSEPELKAGMFVKGRIVTSSRTAVLQVPRAALTAWDMGGSKGGLYVVEKDRAHARQVRTGAVAGERVEIAAGLAPGETYIVRGGFAVHDGRLVAVKSLRRL